MASEINMDTRSPYLRLLGKVDTFFASVYDSYPDRMQCGPGCSDCCHSRFSVTSVEADYIAEGLASLELSAREQLRTRARTGNPNQCAALDDRGLCEIHPWRPLICRSHGAPVYCPEPGDALDPESSDTAIQKNRVHLPIIEVCPKNFRTGFDDINPRLVLDQNTVSTVLGAIDEIHSDARGLPRGTRIGLAELMAQE